MSSQLFIYIRPNLKNRLFRCRTLLTYLSQARDEIDTWRKIISKSVNSQPKLWIHRVKQHQASTDISSPRPPTPGRLKTNLPSSNAIRDASERSRTSGKHTKLKNPLMVGSSRKNPLSSLYCTTLTWKSHSLHGCGNLCNVN